MMFVYELVSTNVHLSTHNYHTTVGGLYCTCILQVHPLQMCFTVCLHTMFLNLLYSAAVLLYSLAPLHSDFCHQCAFYILHDSTYTFDVSSVYRHKLLPFVYPEFPYFIAIHYCTALLRVGEVLI